MNIKEVLLKTTVGPFHKDSQGGYPVSVSNDGDMLLCQANGENQTQAEANAALVAHCVNHFPEMYKALVEAFEFIGKNGYAWTPISKRLVGTIVDAENVKGL